MSTAGDPLTGIPPGADNGDMPLHDDVAHPQVLANADPAQLWNAVYRAVEFLEDYGWWVLAALVLLYTVYVVLEAQIQAALARHRERQRLRRFEGNPHIAQEYEERKKAARDRQQSKVEQEAIERQKREEEAEKRRVQERLDDWQRHTEGKGYRNKSQARQVDPKPPGKPSDKKKGALKPEYNPLAGASGPACSYRPGRRRGGG